MANLTSYIISAINTMSTNVTSISYGGDDSSNMASDGKYVYWTNDQGSVILVYEITRSGDTVKIASKGNLNFSNLTVSHSMSAKVYVRNKNKVVFLEQLASSYGKLGYMEGKLSTPTGTIALYGVKDYINKFGKRILAYSSALPVTFSGLDGFWTVKHVSGGNSVGSEATVGNCSYISLSGDFRGATMLAECWDIDTLSVIKTVQFVVPSTLPSGQTGYFGQEGVLSGFEVPGLLCMGIGDSLVFVKIASGSVTGSVSLPLTGDTGRDFTFDLDNKVIINDSGDTNTELLYVSRLASSFNPFGNAPSAPSAVNGPSKAIVGRSVDIDWSTVTTPTQPSGLDLDNTTVYYELSFYNGSTWSVITSSTTATSKTYTIPAMSNTGNAKFRVRTYVLLNGVRIYSGYKTSASFTVSNNSVPTISSGLTLSVSSGETIKPLEKVTIRFNLGTDVDEGDTLTGYIDFWNGTEWILIAKDSISNDGVVSFEHTIPAKAVTGAKYRVYTFDGNEFGPTLESYTFNVSKPEPDKQHPNALLLDGVDDFVRINDRVIPANADFTVEGFFKTDSITEDNQTIFAVTTDGESNAHLRFYIEPTGNVALYTLTGSVKNIDGTDYRDGRLHHYAVIRSGDNFRLVIDGVEIGSCTDVGFDLSTRNTFNLGIFRDSIPRAFKGTLSLPRFWNDVRTIEELNEGKNTVYEDTEPGLQDYLIFEPTTGKIGCKKNTSITASMNGGIQWTYKFVPMVDIVLPYPSAPRLKGNIDYLRDKINEFRQSNGLPLITWTDATIVKGLTPIKAVHMNEMEDAIEETYTLTGQVILDSSVKEVIEETVLPRDTRFLISDMDTRFDAIVRALMNK